MYKNLFVIIDKKKLHLEYQMIAILLHPGFLYCIAVDFME